MLEQINIAILITVIGVLVTLVNILVEVVKKLTWDKIPTNYLVVFLSVVLTLLVFFAYCAILEIVILWYYVAAAVVVGMLVAYAAMFGFDKLKEALIYIEKLKASGDDNG